MHTRLNNFLYESRSTEIWQHEFTDSIPIKRRNNPIIFRGIKTSPYTYMKVAPSGFDRSSAKGANNAYTLWIDNSPEWSEFPKRSKSLICCTSKSYADYFGLDTKTDRQGPVYAVFPEPDAKFGVCPNKDIWWSRFFDLNFKKGEIKVMAPGNGTSSKKILNTIIMPESFKNMEDSKELNRLIVVGDYVSDLPLHKFVQLLPFVGPGFDDTNWTGFSAFLEKYGLTEMMRSVMTPETFMVKTYAELEAIIHNKLTHWDIEWGLEVWTDAPCMMAIAEPKYLLPDNE